MLEGIYVFLFAVYDSRRVKVPGKILMVKSGVLIAHLSIVPVGASTVPVTASLLSTVPAGAGVSTVPRLSRVPAGTGASTVPYLLLVHMGGLLVAWRLSTIQIGMPAEVSNLGEYAGVELLVIRSIFMNMNTINFY